MSLRATPTVQCNHGFLKFTRIVFNRELCEFFVNSLVKIRDISGLIICVLFSLPREPEGVNHRLHGFARIVLSKVISEYS